MKLILLLLVFVLSTASVSASSHNPKRILLGVDNAGSDWLYRYKNPLSENTALVQALKELGVNFFVYHPLPERAKSSEEMASQISAIDDAMRANGLKYTLNNEVSNWFKKMEIEPGVNEFDHPDGTHRWDLRMEWLERVLPPQKPGDPALVGITYDEIEHCQITRHQFAIHPEGPPLNMPLISEVNGKDMETAFNRLVSKCKWIKERHYKGMVTPSSEQVWPDMHHIFARAGWTVAPKILKENLSSVVMAISLGAVLEYQDRGIDWWVTPDLWCGGFYPGHSPEALRSALLMGYWLGADGLYVENLDFQENEQRHPDAPPRGSLLLWKEDGSYELTNYGKVVQEFYRNYVPSHPRDYDWRSYQPKVAIVRLPDGAWGQKGTMFRDTLLGNSKHPMDDISAEWLHIWPILTHGTARPGAISLNNSQVYKDYPWPFFVPIDSVAVFDHLVSGPVLDSVECFIVCGHALSERTFADISRRVAEGSVCIISRRIYDLHAKAPLPGKWVVVDSFTDPVIAKTLKPFLGPPDKAIFRFKDRLVEFQVGNNCDKLEVNISRY